MSLPRFFLLFLFLIVVVLPAVKLSSHVRDRALVNDIYNAYVPPKIQNYGSTEKLSVLPLINWHTKDDSVSGEQGVSYLIKTDTSTILFDVGHNEDQSSPSPIEKNMETLNISLDDIDSIFISHNHFDHVGGKKWMRDDTFSLGTEQIDLSGKKAFTPIPMNYPGIQPTYTPDPTVISDGVASTGTIPRQLFIGRIDEQALVVNVEGKGLVIIVGCGHQTIARLIERTKAVFDEPIYGIVGDLHYPEPTGRINIAGINAQKIFASGESPFRPLTQAHIDEDVKALKNLDLGIMAVGGHDSSDEVIAQFDKVFSKNYQHVQVGKWINVSSNDAIASN